jgi:hypothetical protein
MTTMKAATQATARRKNSWARIQTRLTLLLALVHS